MLNLQVTYAAQIIESYCGFIGTHDDKLFTVQMCEADENYQFIHDQVVKKWVSLMHACKCTHIRIIYIITRVKLLVLC